MRASWQRTAVASLMAIMVNLSHLGNFADRKIEIAGEPARLGTGFGERSAQPAETARREHEPTAVRSFAADEHRADGARRESDDGHGGMSAVARRSSAGTRRASRARSGPSGVVQIG